MAIPYMQDSLGVSTELAALRLKSDALDIIQVFVYTNLSALVSPNPLLLLPPGIKSLLEGYINFLPGGFFPKDIQEIFNAFVLTNLNSISQQATPVVGPTRS